MRARVCVGQLDGTSWTPLPTLEEWRRISGDNDCALGHCGGEDAAAAAAAHRSPLAARRNLRGLLATVTRKWPQHFLEEYAAREKENLCAN